MPASVSIGFAVSHIGMHKEKKEVTQAKFDHIKFLIINLAHVRTATLAGNFKACFPQLTRL
jgi:hypothetical protein